MNERSKLSASRSKVVTCCSPPVSSMPAPRLHRRAGDKIEADGQQLGSSAELGNGDNEGELQIDCFGQRE